MIKSSVVMLAIVMMGVFSGFMWISGSTHDNSFTTVITKEPMKLIPDGVVHVTKIFGDKTFIQNIQYYTFIKK